ncbi:MAG: NusG domain II-containing protein [Clostridiales bacterium]|nr:NusG domain II-containing protein [Clostridiales bacterium]
MKLKKYDYVIFAILALITIASIAIPFIFSKDYSNALVVIKVNGAEYKTIPLNTNSSVPVNINGNYNLIKVEDGKVRIEDANCPDKLCVRSGSVSRPGKPLVCLPHKLTVEIEGIDNDNDEIDVY